MDAEDYRDLISDARKSIRKYENRIDDCADERRDARNDLSDTNREKINLEKRLEGVIKLIEMMEALDKGVPKKISKANETASDVGKDYEGCIKCSDVSATDMKAVFESDGVEQNANSFDALSDFRAEKKRLEDAIAEINIKIKQLEATIDECTRNISRYQNEISDLNSDIRRYKNRINALTP